MAAVEIAATGRAAVSTFGVGAGQWQLDALRDLGECMAFTVRHDGADEGELRLKAPGRINALNALGVYALARAIGLTHAEIGHVGYRVELPGLTVLHLGDSEPAPGDLAAFLEGRPEPGVALVPYWVLIGSGGPAVVEAIGAACTAAFHLERESGDAVTRLAERVPSAAVLDEPGERLTGEC